MTTRPAAVAGMFYPAFADEIEAQLSSWLIAEPSEQPKALIVPHAGYVYSGETAAQAYKLLLAHRSNIHRVIVVGPNHRVPLVGIAAPSVEQFQTPLGEVAVDQQSLAEIGVLRSVCVCDEAHRQEHALEVQLPFLQSCLDEFKLVPLVIGDTKPEQVAELLDMLWGDAHTLLVLSTDLSHFLSYEQAQRADDLTLQQVLVGDTSLTGHQACGCNALNGFLMAAKHKGLKAKLLAHCNSGDTYGDKRRVVGYASLAYFPH